MSNRTSQHILSTAAQLLGICLIVVSAFHISNYTEKTYLDEATLVLAILLSLSSILSFISIRSVKQKDIVRFESIADYLFMAALAGILALLIILLFFSIK